MSGGYPKPSSLKWTLGGQKAIFIFDGENPQNSESPNGPRRELDFIALGEQVVTTNEKIDTYITVKITQDWNGKTLKCSVMQTDTFVSLSY